MIFTIGYEGLGIERFIAVLKDSCVKTLLDSRHNAISRNPEFSKHRLASRLAKENIRYVHLKEYGIPTEIRKAGNAIDWYIKNVGPTISASFISKYDQPVCFMCMERDINACHRKIILDTMRLHGIEGKDLSSNDNLSS
jgi:uncharacterized protein (DUF488 family)